MESAIERIEAYGAPTYSIAIVRMSSLSVVFSEVGEPQPTTTLTIGFFTRDPIGFEAGNNFYSYIGSNPLISVDRFGYDEYGGVGYQFFGGHGLDVPKLTQQPPGHLHQMNRL